MHPPALLLIEDDPEIRTLLAEFLGREGYSVLAAADGAAADALLREQPAAPDLVILDLMLPGEDGFSICRRLRAALDLPILMLTAKDDPLDRIVGLELGADDYLGKPFHPRELLARIRAILRRAGRQEAEEEPRRRFLVEGLMVDLDGRWVRTTHGVDVLLTSGEFDLLACFVERPQRLLTRDQLLDWTRGRAASPFDRTIDVTVSRLRRKLEAAGAAAAGCIKTVRNGGYVLAAPVRKC